MPLAALLGHPLRGYVVAVSHQAESPDALDLEQVGGKYRQRRANDAFTSFLAPQERIPHFVALLLWRTFDEDHAHSYLIHAKTPTQQVLRSAENLHSL